MFVYFRVREKRREKPVMLPFLLANGGNTLHGVAIFWHTTQWYPNLIRGLVIVASVEPKET